MIVNSISVENLLANINSRAQNSSQSSGLEKFASLLGGQGEGNIVSGENKEMLPAQILQKLGNKEISEQLKAILVEGGKVSLEGNNKKEVLTALLELSTHLKKNTEALDTEGETINIGDILDSLNVENVVVEKAELEKAFEGMIAKLDELMSNLVQKAEKLDIQNIPELKEALGKILEDIKAEFKEILATDAEMIEIPPEKIRLLIPEGQLEKIEQLLEKAEQKIQPTGQDQAPVAQIEIVEPQEQVQTTCTTNNETSNQQASSEVTSEVTSDDAGLVKDVSEKIQSVLEKALQQIIEKLDLQEVANNQKIKINMSEQDLKNLSEIELNLLEKVQILQTLAPTNNENVQVTVSNDLEALKQFDQKLTETLKALSNTIEKQLSEAQGQKINIPELKGQIQAKLAETLKEVKAICKENKIEISLPKLVNELSDDLQKADMTIEKILPGQQKVKNAQLDRQINTGNILAGKNPVTQAGIQAEKAPIETVEQLLEKIKPPKQEVAQPAQPVDSNANLFNMMAGKHNDPALAGVRVQGMSPLTAASIQHQASAMANAEKVNEVTNQVIDKIRQGFNKSQIEMTLNPRQLGKVNLNIVLQRGALIANIVAETGKAADALRTGLDSLKQTLVESGYNIEKIAIQTVDQATQTHNSNPNNQNSSNDETHQQTGQNNPNQKNKQGLEFSLDMGSQNGKNEQNNTEQDNNDIQSTTNTNTTPSGNSTEGNYINTEKGMVDYRV